MKGCVFFLSLLFLSVSFKAGAQEQEIPDALDFDRRNAGVYRVELSPYVGNLFSHKFEDSVVTGGNLQINLTPELGMDANFGYTRLSYDPTSRLGAVITDNNVFLIDGGFVLTVPAAYRSKNGVVEADFFTSIGGGILDLNGSARGAGYVGGGMKIRPKISWFAIRFDIRNYFTSVAGPGESEFEDELMVTVGPTFLIPPEL